MQRLAKAISTAGICSRRDAELLTMLMKLVLLRYQEN